MKTSLYQIASEVQSTLEEIVSLEGELTPEVEQKIKSLENILAEKTDNVVEWVESQNDLVLLAKNKIKDLSEFISRIENRLGKFDEYVNNCMASMGSQKIEGKLHSIVKRKPVQVVTVFDETLIPMEFVKIPEPKPAISKTEIGKALKAGIEVPGAKLEESKTISISYKIK